MTWLNVTIDDGYINTQLPLLPPVIEHLALTNANFSTVSSADKFVTALRGRIVSSIYIERCAIPKASLLMIIMLVEKMQTRVLCLRGIGVDDQICMYIGQFCRDTVSHLDISYNGAITSTGLAHVLTLSLRHLDVSGIQLDRMLDSCDTIGWTDVFECTRALTARHCFLSSRVGFSKACDEFRNQSWNLDTLDFSFNALRSYDAVKFFAAMAHSTIKFLYLNNNDLDDIVLNFIPTITNVSCVFLDGNHMMTNTGVVDMLSVYRGNVAMKHVSMANCGLDTETMLALCEANDDHRREKTTMREKLMEFIGVRDIVEDALALL